MKILASFAPMTPSRSSDWRRCCEDIRRSPCQDSEAFELGFLRLLGMPGHPSVNQSLEYLLRMRFDVHGFSF